MTGVCSGPHLRLVRKLGAETVIDYTRTDFTRAGRRYDVIFDVAGTSSFGRCRRALNPGGVYLTIGSVGAFQPNISAGKGFIALAVLIFGRWSPLGAVAGALVFGFADAIQSTLAVIGSPVPAELLQAFPYVVTLVVVAGLVGRVRPPAADGVPFHG